MIAVLVLSLAFQITPELRQHVEAGLKAKSAGDLQTAIREFRRVAEMAPNLAAAHMNLGAACFANKAYSDAIVSLRKALELDSDLPGAHSMLGASLLAQGFATLAIPSLEKAKSDDLLGVAFLEVGRSREAVEHLESALLKRPDDPDLLYYLSVGHGRLSKEVFDRIRQTSPNSARVSQMLGEAMEASGQRDAAEKHFRAALASRSDLRGLHHALGELYLASADYERAEFEFRSESKLAPGSAATAYKLGSVLLNRGKVAEAVNELRRANQLQPDMPETLMELGRALNASGNAAEAAKYLQLVLQMEKDTRLAESAHFQLAQSYRKLGLEDRARIEMAAFQELRARQVR